LGSAGGGTTAKDAIGNDIIAADWLNTHGPGDRTLTEGLKVQINFFENYCLVHCKLDSWF
ncbi:hypothetical protein CISIN_1g0270052mg, partial [Citrus sinensis]